MIVVWVAACGGDKMVDDTTGDDTEGATTVDGTIGVSSTPTTGDASAPTTTGVETTGGGSGTGDVTTGVVTTGEVTSGGFTTGAPDDPDATLCRAFCDRRPECGLPEGDAMCMEACLAELDLRDTQCHERTTSMFECFSELACAQYVPLATDGDPGPCDGLVDQVEFVCGLEGCDAGGGIDEDGGCSFTKSCRGEPLRRMECDLTTCTCFVEDEPFATCPVEDACVDPHASAKRAEACCDF